MVHPIIVALTQVHQEAATAATAEGASYPVNPRATAVIEAFLAKLRSDPSVDEVPLADLVTPTSLRVWRAVFDNPEQLERLVLRLRYHGFGTPEVRPQPDGGIGILLTWIHPDQDEPEVVNSPRQMFSHMAFLELVAEPDDWRVSRIE